MRNIFELRAPYLKNKESSSRMKKMLALIVVSAALIILGSALFGKIGFLLAILLAVFYIRKKNNDEKNFQLVYPIEPEGVTCERVDSDITVSEATKKQITEDFEGLHAAVLDEKEYGSRINPAQTIEITALVTPSHGGPPEIVNLLIRPKKEGEASGNVSFKGVLNLFQEVS